MKHKKQFAYGDVLRRALAAIENSSTDEQLEKIINRADALYSRKTMSAADAWSIALRVRGKARQLECDQRKKETEKC
tara:strand:+ start:332 stop:562 length:231 start_codon:yes stop_codon:yes gene_type:complete